MYGFSSWILLVYHFNNINCINWLLFLAYGAFIRSSWVAFIRVEICKVSLIKLYLNCTFFHKTLVSFCAVLFSIEYLENKSTTLACLNDLMLPHFMVYPKWHKSAQQYFDNWFFPGKFLQNYITLTIFCYTA